MMNSRKRLGAWAACAGLAVTASAQAQFGFSTSPAGSFTDISGTGTLVITGDDQSGTVTVSAAAANAAFAAGTLNACTNGMVGYGAPYTTFTNAALPNAAFYGGMVGAAVMWDDLITVQPNAGVYSQEITENGVPVLIIEWVRMDHFASSPDNVTFELKIYGGGTSTAGTGPGGAFAQFIYDHTSFGAPGLDNGGSATVGYAYSGAAAEQFSFNAANLTDGMVLSLVHGTSGACCLSEGGCTILSQTNCTSAGGIYRGDDVTCANANCPPNTNLVVNGGFETGDFTGWDVRNATSGSLLFVFSGAAHGGTYDAGFGAVGGQPDVIAQQLTTVAGHHYDFGFWLYNPTAGGDSIQALWNGTAVLDQTPTTSTYPWTHYSFDVVATGTSSEVAFSGLDGPSYIHVDDVRVTDSSTSACYANCDGSTGANFLNVNDFVCFQSAFAAGSSVANCDGSTGANPLNINDFVCFQSAFAAGCSAP